MEMSTLHWGGPHALRNVLRPFALAVVDVAVRSGDGHSSFRRCCREHGCGRRRDDGFRRRVSVDVRSPVQH